MKRWVRLTDEYVAKIKNGSHRKVRLQDKSEIWTHWDKQEGCFFTGTGEMNEWGAYVGDPCQRPTHILVG